MTDAVPKLNLTQRILMLLEIGYRPHADDLPALWPGYIAEVLAEDKGQVEEELDFLWSIGVLYKTEDDRYSLWP
jgi:hypothetical protein